VARPQAPPPRQELRQEEPATPPAVVTAETLTELAAAPELTELLEAPPAWREQLAERVENFRRRRARLKRGAQPDLNLDLDFEGAAAAPSEAAGPAQPTPLDSFTLETAGRGGEAERFPELDVTLEDHVAPGRPAPTWDMVSADGGRFPSPSADTEAVAPRGIEIVLGPEEPIHEAGSTVPRAVPVHSAFLAWRFLAAIVDAFILLVAAALFGMTLWLAGAHLSPRPLNVAILGFIGVFLFLSYFGWFTALTAATPGLSCMGIKVCNLDGAPPTWRESWWRAFGYLVSAASLLLGFVWALFDSEGLTWHDRISRTLLVRVRGSSR
jgi:uncharacterized RDD family membrane protein YckC